MSKYKLFDGKRYKYHASFTRKSTADSEAKILRNNYFARVVPLHKDHDYTLYAIYTRIKM